MSYSDENRPAVANVDRKDGKKFAGKVILEDKVATDVTNSSKKAEVVAVSRPVPGERGNGEGYGQW